MRAGSWNFWKVCPRVAPGILGVALAAVTGIAPQKVLAAGSAPHERSYFLYVGTYTGHNSKGIYQYRFDEKNGSLTAMGLAAEIGNPSFLATDPTHRYLYEVTESANQGSHSGMRSGFVSSFSIDPKTGALTFLNRMPSGGRGPAHLTLDKTGKILFVANYGSGSVASFAIENNGSIGAMTAMDQHQGSSVNPARQKGPHAHEVVVSPDNRFLFVPDLGLDKIMIYKIDLAKRKFTANDPAYAAVKPGLGPRHFAFGASGKFAYAVCEMGASVVTFSYDKANGRLTPIQTISILPANFHGADQGSEIQVDPSGRHLYASNQGPEDGPVNLADGRITVFQIDGKTGLLKQLQFVPSGGRVLRNFVLDPRGKYLLAGNEASNTITVFTIAGNGEIAPTKQVVEVASPASLLFVPAP
ncbi:MAG TPA: lactonase family protein [Acidobacteriaceae bacterium]|nr:lactonase family protein [Acidobacteriaceae bacterium]